ncbi:microtubule-associated serine threonine- kinase 2-like isoform X1 [Labeo rohita]|uniref:Microtubule-associated serine threonine-kinase 2-like isoform X1 n=1 Tax=Labeo rohita TaxID=84645 RepID=A0A498NU96_LABRO|nr:microtubule-associated serine threonine- kinase 2-like isoform X1 [Labeo rohita]
MRKQELPAPPPLLFRKLSNPDLSPAAGKTKLHRQLSQDDTRARRSSMAGILTGKQLLPLSSSMHGGVSQLAWQQHAGEPNNLVRMRSQSFGQSAPSLTAGLLSKSARDFYALCCEFGFIFLQVP